MNTSESRLIRVHSRVGKKISIISQTQLKSPTAALNKGSNQIEEISQNYEMSLGFTIGVFGILILSHAAYSTIQYRGLLKIMEEEFSGPPMNVVLELILGFLFCMYAGLSVPGKFQSIHPDSEENRIVSLPENLDFMIFNHRARMALSETDMKLKL